MRAFGVPRGGSGGQLHYEKRAGRLDLDTARRFDNDADGGRALEAGQGIRQREA